MKKIKVNVTQRDLDSKRPPGKDICSSCPIARAVRRHKEFAKGSVTYESIYVPSDLSAVRIRIRLPREVHDFIYNYGYDSSDRSAIKPFSFTIEVPDELRS